MLIKRLTDTILSLGALLTLSPILAAICVLIKMDSTGPIIFKQKRVGKGGELFDIYKFRTMRTDAPNVSTEEMLKLPSPITRVGNILRKSSLDELPQLFNVLMGQMSLVGPRPALYNQYALTELRQKEGVLEFLPGITGWAQINGRDELPDATKVEYDKYYCDNWSNKLDWQIIFSTFSAVLNKRGAY